MTKKFLILFFVLSFLIPTIQNCSTDTEKNTINTNTNNQNDIFESFRKSGWIKENKYRAVVFIITIEECRNSSFAEIEEKIKFEALKHLQRELSPTFSRNASALIKNLVDNSGRMIKAEEACVEGNIYFYDIEKKDLKNEFQKIKNLK